MIITIIIIIIIIKTYQIKYIIFIITQMLNLACLDYYEMYLWIHISS